MFLSLADFRSRLAEVAGVDQLSVEIAIGDLAIDSIAVLEFVYDLEDECSVEFDGEKLFDLVDEATTVGALYRLLSSLIVGSSTDVE